MYATFLNAVTGMEEPDQTADGASWLYAAPVGGINNSVAAVPIKGAASVNRGVNGILGLRNYLTSLELTVDNTLAAQVEVMVLDGATVIWRGKVNATTPPTTMTFDPVSLRGSPNTTLNVQLGSAVVGGVYINAQGYVGL